jgi:hypothetical protein
MNVAKVAPRTREGKAVIVNPTSDAMIIAAPIAAATCTLFPNPVDVNAIDGTTRNVA